MHPLKFRSISESLGEDFGLSSQTIQQVAQVYYDLVQQKLSSLEHIAVDVPGLGAFTLKPGNLERKILKTKKMIGTLETKTSMKAFAIRSEKTADYQKLTALQQKHQTEQTRRKSIRQARYENVDQSVQKPESDS